jgi:hypothetical protein
VELLKDKYSSRVAEIADAFVSCPAANTLAPLLIANSSETLPAHYINLLFESEFTQRHVVVAALALAQNHTAKVYAKILESWEEKYRTIDSKQNSFALRALYLSLCGCDKNMILAKIGAVLSLSNLNGPPILETIPLATIRPDKLAFDHKARLTKLLSDVKVSENCLPIKIEMLGICGENMEMTKRIKYLQNLFLQPVEEIIKAVDTEPIKSDPILMAAFLMGLNNRLEVSFIEDPSEHALTELGIVFGDLDVRFGRKLGQLIDEKPHSAMSLYLRTLSRYNIHTKSNLGNFSEKLNALLSGSLKYNRVVETDFSGYFYKEEQLDSLEG